MADLLDLALCNASHEETISKLQDEIAQLRSGHGRIAASDLESGRVNELMGAIEMMAGQRDDSLALPTDGDTPRITRSCS